MSSTTFVDYTTPIVAAWLNDVNGSTYGGTVGQVWVASGSGNVGSWVAQSTLSVGSATTASAAPWSGITGKPTTLTGYSIVAGDALFNTVSIGGNAATASTASTLASGATGVTPAANDNSTKVPTTAFVLGTNNTYAKAQRGAVTALTDAATVAVDLSLSNNFSVTLGGNRTLGTPTNVVAGQSGCITITQDATGSRTLAYNANWKFAGGVAPVLSTAAGSIDTLSYYAISSTQVLITPTKGIA